jgi:phosphate transport system substrate-binding protein
MCRGKKLRMTGFAVLAVLLHGTTFAALAAEVLVGAGAAPAENIFKRIQAPMEKAIGIKLKLITNGPVEAFRDLDTGQVDAAAAGLDFSAWMELMKKGRQEALNQNDYKSFIIGKDIIRVITNKDVNVNKLSKEQLKGIFTGSIKNWSEVGGQNKPIVVVWGQNTPGTNSVFQKQIMDGEPYKDRVLVVATAPLIKEKVASTPSAVGIGPVSIVDASVAAPEIPEVGRPITLLTKGEPSRAVSKMLDFIHSEGQTYIVK